MNSRIIWKVSSNLRQSNWESYDYGQRKELITFLDLSICITTFISVWYIRSNKNKLAFSKQVEIRSSNYKLKGNILM